MGAVTPMFAFRVKWAAANDNLLVGIGHEIVWASCSDWAEYKTRRQVLRSIGVPVTQIAILNLRKIA